MMSGKGNCLQEETTLESQVDTCHEDVILKEQEAVKIDILATNEKNVITKEPLKIQKVPKIMLRHEYYKECFKPRELSIGPIYAKHSSLNKKELKLELAESFIEESGKTREFLLNNIKSTIKNIKMYFSEEVIESYTDEKLFELVFLDGCAILQFIQSYVKQNLKFFGISSAQAALIWQDLFLLENQIPFKVLQELMRFSKRDSTNLKNDFTRFIIMSSIIVPNHSRDQLSEQYELEWTSTDSREPNHLLDLYRRFLLRETHDSPHSYEYLPALACCTFFCIFIALVFLIFYAVELLFGESHDLPEYWSNLRSFHTVQELKTVGIRVKKADSLKDIKFLPGFLFRSQLFLPTLVFNYSTKHMLMNLIAYETVHDVDDAWVTSYVNMLDLLIDNEEDIMDLRAADVIRNCLSSDVEVAQLINSIGSEFVAPPNDTFLSVKKDIEMQYRTRSAIWMAQICPAHFSSPLTILALFAAMVVLVLTGVQAYYAINPKK